MATATDPEAFGTFYRRHVRALLSFFRRRVAGPELALDLTAETFAAALEASPCYELRPDKLRRALGMAPIVLTDDGIERVEAMAGVPALEVMEGLPAQQRDAVRARVVDGRAYADIADELRCSPSVVRKRVSRGLEAMPWPSAPRPARRRSSLGAVAAVALSGVAVLVALGALVTLRGHAPERRAATRRAPATRPAAAIPGREQLIDILGVLRRRQTTADLSPWVRNALRAQPFGPPDVPLIRRVRLTPWGSGIVLIPTKPSPARFPFPARTEEGIDLEVDGGGGCCATAATIAASGAISIDGAGRSFAGGSTQARLTVLVPDGVATVQFLLAHPPDPLVRVHDNVAAVQVDQRCCTGGAPMIWRAADGQVIKRVAGPGAAGRAAPPPRPGPETALSRAAEHNPSTPNRVWVRPAVGGPHANFKVHFQVLLNDADYSYTLTGTRCPGITLNGGDGGGTNDVRGRVWSDALDAVAGQAWCPGTYHLSVTIADLGRYGQLKQPASPFGSAAFTVKP